MKKNKIKYNKKNKSNGKQVRMYSWLLKVLSSDMKTKRKNKEQSTKNHKN